MGAQDLGRDAHLNRIKPGRSDATAFAVAPVVHLLAGGDNVPTGNRHIRGKTQHAAAAFRRRRLARLNRHIRDQLYSRV
jgi:hypothetical protein